MGPQGQTPHQDGPNHQLSPTYIGSFSMPVHPRALRPVVRSQWLSSLNWMTWLFMNLSQTLHGSAIYAYIDPQSTTPGRFSAVRHDSPRQVVSGFCMHSVAHATLKGPGAKSWLLGPASLQVLQGTASFVPTAVSLRLK